MAILNSDHGKEKLKESYTSELTNKQSNEVLEI